MYAPGANANAAVPLTAATRATVRPDMSNTLTSSCVSVVTFTSPRPTLMSTPWAVTTPDKREGEKYSYYVVAAGNGSEGEVVSDASEFIDVDGSASVSGVVTARVLTSASDVEK